MLHEFITDHREEIIERTKRRAGERMPRGAPATRLERGVPTLLTQVVAALAAAQAPRQVGPPVTQVKQDITESAAVHGRELLHDGLTVTQVVNGYGDVCQIVTDLAVDSAVAISAQEFHVFNCCLDDAISGAVSAYTEQRERNLAYEGRDRLAILAHEMRNLLNTMTLSFAIIREGKVGLGGSTGAMLARSMAGLCALVDRSITEVRLESKSAVLEPISMVEFIEEMQVSGAALANGYGLQLTVHPVDRDLVVDGDWHLLASAVSNLLQNAFKFSRANGHVSLATRVSGARVFIDVADECGGLPSETAQPLFQPFVRGATEHSGLGLGLTIALAAARANNGDIQVRDVPGTGCVFSIDLPCRAPPAAVSAV